MAIRNAGFSPESLLKKGIILAVSLIFIFLVVWTGLKIYESYANKKIQSLQAEQAVVFSANDKLEANKILAFEENAAVLQTLLKSHLYTSTLFDWLAKFTLAHVQWVSCGLDSQKGSVTLRGLASDYSTLAKQLLVFNLEETGFTNIQVSNVALAKTGGLNFDLTFEIDSKKLQKQ